MTVVICLSPCVDVCLPISEIYQFFMICLVRSGVQFFSSMIRFVLLSICTILLGTIGITKANWTCKTIDRINLSVIKTIPSCFSTFAYWRFQLLFCNVNIWYLLWKFINLWFIFFRLCEILVYWSAMKHANSYTASSTSSITASTTSIPAAFASDRAPDSSFEELVSKLFSCNIVLVHTDQARHYLKSCFGSSTSFANVLNQFASIANLHCKTIFKGFIPSCN